MDRDDVAFPDPNEIAPHATAFARMMFAHAAFEREVRLLIDAINPKKPGFGERPENQWTASESGTGKIIIFEIIRSVVESLSDDFNDHHVEPRTDLTAKLPHVYGNKSQLQEVISNLIFNAIEAMETTSDRSRMLLVRSELRDHEAVAVVVKDSGPGIDKERLDGVFTTFVSTKQHGMGLGLPICRMIIDYHGGKLTASSDGKDGASFQFVLPIASEDRTALGPNNLGS